jgi:hypothetical protein
METRMHVGGQKGPNKGFQPTWFLSGLKPDVSSHNGYRPREELHTERWLRAIAY